MLAAQRLGKAKKTILLEVKVCLRKQEYSISVAMRRLIHQGLSRIAYLVRFSLCPVVR